MSQADGLEAITSAGITLPSPSAVAAVSEVVDSIPDNADYHKDSPFPSSLPVAKNVVAEAHIPSGTFKRKAKQSVELERVTLLRDDNGEDGDDVGSGGESEQGGEEDDCELIILLYYPPPSPEHTSDERSRQRLILQNQQLLTTLGIHLTPSKHIASSSSLPHTKSAARRKRESMNRLVFDRSGHVTSLPAPGEIQTLACVEIPSDRKLARRIAEGEYQEFTHWARGEARRRRFGSGRGGKLAEDETEEVGGVGVGFRWRKWGGLDRELRKEMKKRGDLIEMDSRPVPTTTTTTCEPTAYSVSSVDETLFKETQRQADLQSQLLPGDPCHQCRRKSEKPRMKCRNVDPLCRASFCETCCKRYSYFSFDPDSRSFICPLCKDCCNCANCIRKRNLAHLLAPGEKGIRAKSLKEQGKGHITVQGWIDQAIVDRVGAPFDRVRLVDEATDVISPDSPPEVEEVIVAEPIKKRKKGPVGRKPKKVRTEVTATEGDWTIVKSKTPKEHSHKPAKKAKEIDSDGDTVGGWSDEDDGHVEGHSNLSSLTPLSRSPSPVPPRFAFPPHPPVIQQMRPRLYVSSAGQRPLGRQDPLPHRVNTMDQTLPVPQDPEVQSPTTTASRFSPERSAEITPPGDGGNAYRHVKRKPPPQARIVRLPRHAITPPGTAVPLPARFHSAQVSAWQPTFNHYAGQPQPHLAQPYAFDHYSTTYPIATYPTTNHSLTTHPYTLMPGPPPPANIAQPGRPELTTGPPPYSHSPIMRSVPVPASADEQYLSPPWPQNLDLLSLAAAEARQSPSLADSRNRQAEVLSQAAQTRKEETLPLWAMDQMMVDRRYHPDYM